jgi:hypothetical protein
METVLDQRRPMMQSWCEYCTGAASGNVVAMNRA